MTLRLSQCPSECCQRNSTVGHGMTPAPTSSRPNPGMMDQHTRSLTPRLSVFTAMLICTVLLWLAADGPWRSWETQAPGASWTPTRPNGDCEECDWDGDWLRPLAILCGACGVGWLRRDRRVVALRSVLLLVLIIGWVLGPVVLEHWAMLAALRRDGWTGDGLSAPLPDGTGPPGTRWRVSVG
jgi:hypothetical protein